MKVIMLVVGSNCEDIDNIKYDEDTKKTTFNEIENRKSKVSFDNTAEWLKFSLLTKMTCWSIGMIAGAYKHNLHKVKVLRVIDKAKNAVRRRSWAIEDNGAYFFSRNIFIVSSFNE